MNKQTSNENRKNLILGIMSENKYAPMRIKDLAVLLAVPKTGGGDLAQLMDQLEKEGKVVKTKNEKYALAKMMNHVIGRLDVKQKGFAFLIPDDIARKDVFITQENLNGAMHNDRVMVSVTGAGRDTKREEGEVARILERANTTVVGTFEKDRHFGFVTADDNRITGDIFIAKNEFNNAQSGQKVVAEIVRYPEKRRNAEGRIKEILGYPDDAGVAVLSIIKEYELSEEFPPKVAEEARRLCETAETIERALKNRKDLRGIKMVTIDGEDAKDLDDAVSLEILPNGIHRLGVHIADVSHYVREGSALDKEAYSRATSVYLADRVIPMLPHELSNGICSLNAGEDRLAFSVVMNIDKHGKVLEHQIFESLINVNERMTYTDVAEILLNQESELRIKYGKFTNDFENMRALAGILKRKRHVRGAVDFEFDEAKIIFDDKGEVVDVRTYHNTIANSIIEEFMLACNETVAEHFNLAGIPFMYRIHEEPSEEKMENLAEFAFNHGYPMKHVKKMHPKIIQELLERAREGKEFKIIEKVALRSMQKARYSSEHGEHFGLAAEYYCHFTSPIRRYPDLLIHRLIKEYTKGAVKQERTDGLCARLPEAADHCSLKERIANDAERDTDDLMKAVYMKDKIGNEYDGIISSVTGFGLFVELDNTVEGLVHISAMDDDYYIYDEKRYVLTGERTKKTYSIGDSVHIKVVKADTAARKIDFSFTDIS